MSILIFIAGALGYGGIEVFFRGFTHWTMMLTGGACLLTLYYLNQSFKDAHLVLKALAGTLIITLYEFSVGLIVNRWYGWEIWDYSHLPYNFFGQICLVFALRWFFLCCALLIIAEAVLFFYNHIMKEAHQYDKDGLEKIAKRK